MKTKEEILEQFQMMYDKSAHECYEREDVKAAMDEYAKQFAELAFDAGYNLCAKHETNHPNDAITKEEFIAKYFL